MTNSLSQPTVVAVGANPTLLWGMTATERTRRIAGKAGLAFADAPPGTGANLLVNTAFAFDPPLLAHMAGRPATMLVKDGIPAIAFAPDAGMAAAVRAAMAGGVLPDGIARIDHDAGFTLYNDQLRKREQPFLTPLTPATVKSIERASYYAAYKGVTDVLTKYLWPEWALVLTRIAARIGMSPNMVTGIGAVLCIAAFFLFRDGDYWAGMAAGLGFMVLDTVDGKLARCTITSSKWGNVADHGIDLIHPPFWWWAWGAGLPAWGLAFDTRTFSIVMAVILGGYVLQRLIEGIFLRRFAMHIHVWEKVDSDFRLVTARRNPNMVLLFLSVIAGRPDIGLIAVAGWTLVSLLFHAVRLAQALAAARAGRTVTSWLVGEAR